MRPACRTGKETKRKSKTQSKEIPKDGCFRCNSTDIYNDHARKDYDDLRKKGDELTMFNQKDFDEFFNSISRNKNEKVLEFKTYKTHFEITTNLMIYIIRNK